MKDPTRKPDESLPVRRGYVARTIAASVMPSLCSTNHDPDEREKRGLEVEGIASTTARVCPLWERRLHSQRAQYSASARGKLPSARASGTREPARVVMSVSYRPSSYTHFATPGFSESIPVGPGLTATVPDFDQARVHTHRHRIAILDPKLGCVAPSAIGRAVSEQERPESLAPLPSAQTPHERTSRIRMRHSYL